MTQAAEELSAYPPVHWQRIACQVGEAVVKQQQAVFLKKALQLVSYPPSSQPHQQLTPMEN